MRFHTIAAPEDRNLTGRLEPPRFGDVHSWFGGVMQGVCCTCTTEMCMVKDCFVLPT